MSTPLTTLFEEARKLTPLEREQLAEMLFDTLDADDDVEGAWAIEADRRWRDHIASKDTCEDALEAVEDVRRDLKGGASSNKPELVVMIESPVSEAKRNAIFADIKARFAAFPELGKFNQEI